MVILAGLTLMDLVALGVSGLLVLGLLVFRGRVSGAIVGLGIATLGSDHIGNESVTLIAVVNGLDAAIGELDVVRARDSLAGALLLVAEVDVRGIVLNIDIFKINNFVDS